MNTDIYKRASIQAQRNKNQFEQAQRSYERFCRRERALALAMFILILIGVGAVLAAIATAIVRAIL